MIRFAWLQSRTQALLALGALAIVAVVLALTGPHLANLYSTNVAGCTARGTCDIARDAFLRNDKRLRTWLDVLVVVIPGIIGLFWGAPLIARELETGTYRLAWTQSVSRTRWLAVKLAVVGLAGIAVAGIFSLMLTWWANPIDAVNANRFSPPTFDQRGIVAIGYAAFAVALGATAGVLIRRTLPAMVTTLVAFLAARMAVIEWVRPHLAAARHRVFALDAVSMGFQSSNGGNISLRPQPPDIPNAWIYSTHVVDNAGHVLTPQILTSACPRLGAIMAEPPRRSRPGVREVPDDIKATLHDCVAKVANKYHAVSTFQPAGRYWTFQLYELAIFLAAALALSAFCFWWIRRRLA